MLKLLGSFLFLIFFISFELNATTLVLIGGGNRPKEALAYFVQKTQNAPIYVLPWGTSYPKESFASIKSELEEHGNVDVRCFCSASFSRNDYIALSKAGGIYFPGGDQNKVMKRIFKAKIKNLIHRLYKAGVPVAGTSAGTAIQSNPMLTGSGIQTSEGLGLLPNFIVDQHFLVRARQERLLGALEENTNLSGLGIDENMSVVVENSSYFTALGPSIITFYLRKNNNLKKIEISHQQSFEP